MSNKQHLLILGDGSYAVDVADLAEDSGQYEIVGFVHSVEPHDPERRLLDRPVYWVDEVARFAGQAHAVCAIGTTHRHRLIEQVAEMGISFANVIHPTARISRRATLGVGVIVSSGVQIATHTQISDHVIINRGATIGHHNRIGRYVTISPGANLAGYVTVGERAYIALGANVLEKSTIGELAVVGAGALVTKDVGPRTLVIGIPARVAREGIEGL